MSLSLSVEPREKNKLTAVDMSAADLSAYELQREENIRRNQEQLRALGLVEGSSNLGITVPQKNQLQSGRRQKGLPWSPRDGVRV